MLITKSSHHLLLLLFTVNIVLLNSFVGADGERGFDLFGWAKKKENKNEVKIQEDSNRDEVSNLVRELEDLDDGNQVRGHKDVTSSMSQQQPEPSDTKRIVPPPRRPPPPMTEDLDLTGDQEEKVLFADRTDLPEGLRGCVKNNNNPNLCGGDQRRSVRPNIRYTPRDVDNTPRTCKFGSDYLGKKLKCAYKRTKKSIIKIPKYVEKASDMIAVTMNINEKGRLVALINQLNKTMGVVRQAFSQFTEVWSPMMEQALNYVGSTNLNKVRWNDNDEFDFRRDALTVLAAGYEFMRVMIAWRQNTLIAHAAYRLYLETVKRDLSDPAIVIDEQFIYKLEAIHHYILFKSWLIIDSINLEPKMKFEYISQKHDQRTRNYESDYFRSVIIFQELYEPTMDELEAERQAVIDSMSTAGAFADEFLEVDEFIEDFIKSLDESPIQDIELTPELIKFMTELKPEIQYNPQIYEKKFMLKLIEAREEAMKELKQDDQA